MYNALGQRVEDYQADSQGNAMTLTYPVDITGRRTGTWDQWPAQNWTGWDVYWSRVAGQHISMGGGDSWLAHSDAIGSTTMVTDETGAWVWDQVFGPWGHVWQQTGTRPWFVFAGLRWPVNDPLKPSATREYSSNVFRWMTPDPGGRKVVKLDDPQTWNMYAYALDNPTTLNDPSGLNACGTNDDSSCKVTITFASRTKDKNGNYNDQFVRVKNSSQYNTTAKVSVNGKEVGTFLARSTPSDAGKYATILNGTYTGVLTSHDGRQAIRLVGRIPVIAGLDPLTGKSFATGILVHTASGGNQTGLVHNSQGALVPSSEGCQLVCTSQYNRFLRAIGVEGQQGPQQQHFNVNVNTLENQDFPVGITDLLGTY
jgi:RHS repeat-associated protein